MQCGIILKIQTIFTKSLTLFLVMAVLSLGACGGSTTPQSGEGDNTEEETGTTGTNGGFLGADGLLIFYQQDFEGIANGSPWPDGWEISGTGQAAVSPVLSFTVQNGQGCLQAPENPGGGTHQSLGRIVHPNDIFNGAARVNTQIIYENYFTQGVGIYLPHNGEFLDQNPILGKGYASFIAGPPQAQVGQWVELDGIEYLHANAPSPIVPGNVVLNVESEVEQIVDPAAPAGMRTIQRTRVWEEGTPRPAAWSLISDETPGDMDDAPSNPQTEPTLQNLSDGERRFVLDLYNYGGSGGPLSVCFEYIQVTEIPTDPIADIAAPTQVASGFGFAEGPVWIYEEGVLLFTDIVGDSILRYDPSDDSLSVFRGDQAPDAHANGLARGSNGSLIIAEQSAQSLVQRNSDGSEEVLVNNFGGQAFNSPNDVTLHSNGSIFFTDPTFGTIFNGGLVQLLGEQGIYRLASGGGLTQFATGDGPNGIAFSPDESRLYVSDTTANVIRAFNVAPAGTVSGEITGAGTGFPVAVTGGDGMAVDAQGNIYVARGDNGIDVLDRFGELWGNIDVPGESVRNVAFGGEDLTDLYITVGDLVGGAPGSGALYRVQVNLSGVGLPGGP